MSVLMNNLFKTGGRFRRYSRLMFHVTSCLLRGLSSGQSFVASLVGFRCSLKDLQESNDLEV